MFAATLAALAQPVSPASWSAALDLLEDGSRGNWQPFRSALVAVGRWLAAAGTRLEDFVTATDGLTDGLTAALIAELATDAPRLAAAVRLAQRLITKSLATMGDAYLDARAHKGPTQAPAADTPPALAFGPGPIARLLESGIMGILLCDTIGNIKEANDTFLQMVGYSRTEVLSGKVRWAEMTPPEYQSLDDAAVQQLQERGVTRPWEKEYIRKDGSRVPILVGVALLNETECIAFVLDITERRRLDELRRRSAELETQNRRIQEASRLKSEFLANMSHELRTPLNSIIGFAEVLQRGEVSPASSQHEEFLGYILNGGRHLLQLINDVLDLAKVEAGKIEFRPAVVNLSVLVGEVDAILRHQIAAKSLTFETVIDPAVEYVILDPARLKQVLYNYLSNAMKFTPDGGKVALRVAPDGPDMFRLEVTDSGIGIDPNDLGRLFVEFQQLDPGMGKKHAGTGLGLALTKRIVEAQGGSVGVHSTPGIGSTFFATLPRQALASTPTALPLLPLPETCSAVVLVIEDDGRDRALLVQTLEKSGYGVQIAETGGQAVSRCEERVFDAITLDLLLPDMTGLDVLHRVRLGGKNADTPVIVVSVVADRGLVGGFAVHDYLCKPINGKDLICSLDRAGVTSRDRGPILIVDDDPASARLMEANLTRLGFETTICLDGESGLATAESRPPRAVILDLLMPGMDGFGFLSGFRKIPALRHTPVIVWTMKDLTGEDQIRLSHLAQAVILKQEGDPSQLISELRQHLPATTKGP